MRNKQTDKLSGRPAKSAGARTIVAACLLLFSACSDNNIEIPEEDPVAVTGVELNRVSMTLFRGRSEKLIATVSPADADNKAVRWESSNLAVAVVSNGMVTAALEGTTTIEVSTIDGNKIATCDVTVVTPPLAAESVTVSPDKVVVSTGSTIQLTATVLPANAPNKNVIWKSGNTATATVDANGLVTGGTTGTAVITATTEDGGLEATCTVTVPACGLIVADNDLPGYLRTWAKAMTDCPEGWRLPDKDEMLCMCRNQGYESTYALDGIYWSSTEDTEDPAKAYMVWNAASGNYTASSQLKTYSQRVRCVR